MNVTKIITLAVLIILSVSCSNKGNGEKFYLERYENTYIIHSRLDCKAIKGGVRSAYPGRAGGFMCSKCMDDELYEIATERRYQNVDDDVDDDDVDDDDIDDDDI